MIRKKHHLTLWLSALLLSCAIIIALRSSGVSDDVKYDRLLDDLPRAEAPWSQRDLDVAESAEMKRAVDELLNYDRAIFRKYERGGDNITVYASHWRPRKFHPRLISIHTPDICWVSNGWHMRAADYSYALNISPEGPAWPAQYREFDAGGETTYVVYWHTVGESLSGYGQGPNSKSDSFLANFFDDVRQGAGEQLFIRISSNRPFTQWKDDAFFLTILNSFRPVLASR